MKSRVFQVGFWMLLSVALLMPILECFDHWDAPGLSKDGEFAVFALVLIFCLLLAVCKVLLDRAQTTDIEVLPLDFVDRQPSRQVIRPCIVLEVIPSVSPPLRI